MNFSPVQNFLSSSFSFLENQLVKPLSAQQKKVFFIALAIFSLILSSIYIYRQCYQTKKIVRDLDSVNLQEPLKKSKIKSVETQPQSHHSTSTKLDFEQIKQPVKESIQKDGASLEFASNDQNDREMVKRAVQKDGSALKFASKDLQNDREIVKLAVQDDGSALKFASKDLQNDQEIVKVAVQQNGWALEFASKDLQNARNIVKIAIQEEGRSFKFASKHLQNDLEIIKLADQYKGWSLELDSNDL